MRFTCENCECGYSTVLNICPHCGASSTFAHQIDPTDLMCDTECYRDYWLCGVGDAEFQLFPGYPLDVNGLRRALSSGRIVTFNGINYDLPMIALALAGADNATLKRASDTIIKDDVRSREFYEKWGLTRLDWIDHIDLIEVAPGQGSLKAYGGKMHSRKLQDLPIDPDTSIDWADRALLRQYCANDRRVTRDLFESMDAQIRLREEMSAEYGVDLRSKSDAQIAEAVMKSLLPFRVEIPKVAPGTQFYYRPPEWAVNSTPKVRELVARLNTLPFHVNMSGNVSPSYHANFIDWGDKQVRLNDHGEWVTRPAGFKSDKIIIGSSSYTMGIGGLHSCESCIAHYADDDWVITDHDVASYYPTLIVNTGIYPQQIGPIFCVHYRGWRDTRVVYKRVGDKKKANSLKTLLNGTFGKLMSKWSIFYAPSELLQVTLTGQLALLILIEMLELAGIKVISANTDGIVLKTHRDLEWARESTIKWWESLTGFETERTDYRLLASRDVNNYIAIKTDGEVKLKGEYAPPEPGASGWPNPSGQVCVDAVVARLTRGADIASTIRECDDVRRFVYVRNVKGGGAIATETVLDKKVSKRKAESVAGSMEAYLELVEQSRRGWSYLGKVVRWYYATESHATIRYVSTGNLVPKTLGCAPLMELPDSLPADVDHDWYVREAESMLVDIGVSNALSR